jgi:hypothetical protein
MVKFLLDQPFIDIDAPDNSGNTVLHSVILGLNQKNCTNSAAIEVMNLLFDKSCNPELHNTKGYSALRHACEREMTTLVDNLVQHGAQLQATTFNYWKTRFITDKLPILLIKQEKDVSSVNAVVGPKPWYERIGRFGELKDTETLAVNVSEIAESSVRNF